MSARDKGSGDHKSEPDRTLPSPESNPYQPPETEPPRKDLATDPSVFAEPWMKDSFVGDMKSGEEVPSIIPPSADPEHSVWDEPGVSAITSGPCPVDAVTWFRWYQSHADQTTWFKSWVVTGLVSSLSGSTAIVGVFAVNASSASSLVMTVVAAPICEEIMKIAVAIWVCEKRPWLFHSRIQILICGLLSGLVFAAIENVLYLRIYVANPSAGLIAWRWSVCVMLHAGCSLIAAIGVLHIWQEFQRKQRMPQLTDGSRWIIAAIGLHGAYNLAVTLLEYANVGF